jgi:hypothetical protein
MIDRKTLFQGWPGCADHNCIVYGVVKGMATNGGCRCILNASRSQLRQMHSRLSVLLKEIESQSRAGEQQ